MSPFSRLINYGVECQFRRDPSGRLVFLPFGPRKKGYFIDSKSDEDKTRAFVKMYRTAAALMSLLVFPSVYVPGVILDVFAGLSPQRHRLGIALGIPAFFWVVLMVASLVLWSVYKQTVQIVTSSLTEVGPDMQNQLTGISSRPKRLALVVLGAGTILLGISLLTAQRHVRSGACPAKSAPGCR